MATEPDAPDAKPGSAAAEPGPAWRWSVLLFLSLALFGGYYVYDSLGMAADLIKQALGISDAQYGILTGAYSLAAVLVLLGGGVVIDRIGAQRAVLLFGGITSLAGVVIALSPSYPAMLAGRFLLGVGSEPLIVAVTTALVRWFKGRELAFAFGLNITAARLGSVAADRSPQWAPSFYAGAGDASRPLGLAAVIGLSCVLCALVYAVLEARAQKRFALGAPGTPDRISLAELRGFGASYWLLTGLCMAFYAALFPFQSFATKFFIEAHGTPREEAGALLSYLPTASMIATPLIGLLVDRVGRRALLMLLGAVLATPVFFLLTVRGMPLLLPIGLLGIAMSLIPAILWPTVAYLVEEKRLGTAYGLMTLLQQLVLFGVSAALGLANDLAGASAQNPGGYRPGMWLLGLLSVAGLGLSAGLYVVERGPRGHGIERVEAGKTPAAA